MLAAEPSDTAASPGIRAPQRPFDFENYLVEAAVDIDDALKAFLLKAPDICNLRDGALYGMGLDVEDRAMRGKRLRSILCLMTCEALGGARRDAMPFAVASELLHNLALVHDDIADQDETRRWRSAVWVKYGVGHAVNIGDYLFSKAIESTLELQSQGFAVETVLELVTLITQTANRTIEGQSVDIAFHSRSDLTVQDYVEACIAKTGYYLAAPAVGGAIIAGGSPEVCAALHEFGQHAGPAFQIVDDLLDLTRGKGRGEIGADIKEGKRSLLVILVGGVCTSAERARLYEILDTPRAETSEQDVMWAVELFLKYKVPDLALEHAQRLFAAADHAVAQLPETLRVSLRAASQCMFMRRS